MSTTSHRHALAVGTRLHWYRIEKLLGQGGFGITYLAADENLKQPVAIKEFLPTGMALREADNTVSPISDEFGEGYRWGLQRFLSEARTLTQFEHANIIRVQAVFELNKTAYMVMRYEDGQDLSGLLREQASGQRALFDEAGLKRLLFPLMAGLHQVHKAGFIHRDIKPGNIMMRPDGTPVLIDFGSAREAMGKQTQTLTAMISPGYAPFEQYHAKSKQQGPWTDIYGLAATCYRVITGRGPVPALERGETLLADGSDLYVPLAGTDWKGYGQPFLAAIDHGLAFREKDRPQSLKQWLEELKGASSPSVDSAGSGAHSVAQAMANSMAEAESQATQTPVTASASGVATNKPLAEALANNNLDPDALRLLAGEKPKRGKRKRSLLRFLFWAGLAIAAGVVIAYWSERPGLKHEQGENGPRGESNREGLNTSNQTVRSLQRRLLADPKNAQIRRQLFLRYEFNRLKAEKAIRAGRFQQAAELLDKAALAATTPSQRDAIAKRLADIR